MGITISALAIDGLSAVIGAIGYKLINDNTKTTASPVSLAACQYALGAIGRGQVALEAFKGVVLEISAKQEQAVPAAA